MKILSLLAITLTIISSVSCSGQQLGKDVIDLETVPMDFNAAKFFHGSLGKNKKSEPEKDNINDKREDLFNSYNVSIGILKKANTEEGNWADSQGASNETGLTASEYEMSSWHPGKYVAKFDKLSFSKLGMIVSKENEFMGSVAVSDETDSLMFGEILKDLTEKYGKPENQQKDFFGIHYNNTWKLKDRIIQFVSRVDDRKNTLSIEVDERKRLIQQKENPVLKIYLFVISNEYEISLRGKLHSGDWLFLM